jgi:hypothetical protein
MIVKTNFWRRIEKLLGLAQRYGYQHVADLPEVLDLATIYLIGDDTPWSAAMVCPCGCGAVIQLSLISSDNPRWKLKDNRDGTISLHPSIWRTKGCVSHFWVKSGRVMWTRSRSAKRPANRRFKLTKRTGI